MRSTTHSPPHCEYYPARMFSRGTSTNPRSRHHARVKTYIRACWSTSEATGFRRSFLSDQHAPSPERAGKGSISLTWMEIFKSSSRYSGLEYCRRCTSTDPCLGHVFLRTPNCLISPLGQFTRRISDCYKGAYLSRAIWTRLSRLLPSGIVKKISSHL